MIFAPVEDDGITWDYRFIMIHIHIGFIMIQYDSYGFIWLHRFWFWYFWLPDGSDPRLGVLLDYKPSSVGGLSLGQNSAEFFGVC